MTDESEMTERSFAARLAFCTFLVKSFPSGPIDVDARDSEVIGLAEQVLRDGILNDEMYLKGLSSGLLPIIQASERRAEETMKREYKPGNNYGWSGAADTKSESYQYTAVYLRALSAALSADTASCAKHFRGGMRLYAIYSCDSDPKGAVRFAIDEAENKAEEVIAQGVRDAPSEWWSKYEWQVSDTANNARGEIFISFKHLDGQGRETKDCAMAKVIAVYLRRMKFTVFLSLDSLEQLGKSAYMDAIESALQQAKVLIAVGTSVDNLTSRWVKYEWHSFHQEIIEGYKKGGEMFSVLSGISERELPLALRQRQAFPFSDEGLASLSRYLNRALGRATVPE